MTSTRPITDISGSHCSKCGQGGCLCAGSGTNSNSVSCRCSNGFVTGETPDLRLHAHASPPLSVMYLRVCEAPQLTEEVEQKLRTFIGPTCTSVLRVVCLLRSLDDSVVVATVEKRAAQQQDAEKAVRRVLFAIVEMATARQFHLPPPSASLQRYGYDVSISSNMGSLLGEWALQLPQAVRFF
ncbi:hypothetical protein cyc_03199 [Cyclospora cayetanensis]|uniref:Uncharacterized protein n=1 Tax=Cyclospora cayetanensis TaxID=88456 RepID=A0A1D3D9K5_9EIME|nr:hypothetical protein cyc_03199 [Cyclospora cayetanensis]